MPQLPSSLQRGIRNIRGTLMDLIAARMPSKDIAFLAEKWGLTKSAEGSFIKSSGASSSPPPVAAPTATTASPAAVTVSSAPAKASTAPPTTATTNTAVNATIVDKPKVPTSKSSSGVFLLHPILGEFVADLGYKKMYLTSIQGLAAAPVWQKQRTLRMQRATAIAKNKIKNGTATVLPGVISVHMDKKTGSVAIIDGQHRAAALVVLAHEGLWNDEARNITLDVFETDSEKEVSTLFTEINSGEPVKLIDMPTATSTGDDEDKDAPPPTLNSKVLIDEAVDTLAAKYDDMFKPSQNCRPPHVNIDVLRDDIYQSGFALRKGVKSASELVEAIETANAAIGAHFADPTAQATIKSKTAMEKAIKYRFFLGLEKGWVYTR